MPVIEQKTTNKNKVDFDLNRLDKSKTTIFSKYPFFQSRKDAENMKRKIVALCLCVALAVVAIGGATLAYFTDTDEAKNTFTVGNVEIKLDETNVDDPQGDRVQENSYKLIPGVSYVKDPTITVLKGSEDCYVRMKVTLNNASKIKDMCLDPEYKEVYDEEWTTEEQIKILPVSGNGLFVINEMDADTYWSPVVTDMMDLEDVMNDTKYMIYDAATDTLTYIFYYNEVVSAADADVVLKTVFNEIKVNSWVTGEQLAALKDFQINVVAEAIQTSDNFANADEAWAAFDAQK